MANIEFIKKEHLLTSILLLSSISTASAGGLTTKSMLVALAVPAIGGAYTWSIDDVEGLKQWGMSCLVTAHLTTLIKYTTERTRPNGGDDLSFPSGHAASAFVGASYLHHRYGLNWGLPMYAIAAAVSYQRVNVDDHHWSDVIAGAALGYFTAVFFTERYPNAWVKTEVDLTDKSYKIQFGTRF